MSGGLRGSGGRTSRASARRFRGVVDPRGRRGGAAHLRALDDALGGEAPPLALQGEVGSVVDDAGEELVDHAEGLGKLAHARGRVRRGDAREEPPHRASTGALVPSARAPGVSRAAFERSGDVARAGKIPPIAWRERSRRGSRAVEV